MERLYGPRTATTRYDFWTGVISPISQKGRGGRLASGPDDMLTTEVPEDVR